MFVLQEVRKKNKVKFFQKKFLARKSPLKTEKTVLEKPVKKISSNSERTICSDEFFFEKTSRKQISFGLLAISIESTAKKPFLLKVQKLIKLDSFETKKTGLKKAL